jgi:hypothetical protein
VANRTKITILPSLGSKVSTDLHNSIKATRNVSENANNLFALDEIYFQTIEWQNAAINWCEVHKLNLGDEKHPATEASKLLLAIAQQTEISKTYTFHLIIDKTDWQHRVKEYVCGMRVQISRIKAWVKETHIQNKILDINQGLSIEDCFILKEFDGGYKVVEIKLTRAPRGTHSKMASMMQQIGPLLMKADFVIAEEQAPLMQLTFIGKNVQNQERDW